ncbi:MAG: DegV family protein [Clostridia bacterium]
MKIAISAESTADMTKSLMEEYDVHTIPFQVLLGENEYKDGEISPNEIFDYVKKTKILPKTSAINEMDYQEYFASLLKDYDAVVHITLSSGLSSSYSNAEKASKTMNNVYVIDSKSLSTGIALLVLFASKLAKSGKSAEEVYALTMEQIGKVQASFVIDKLDYLYKGGRCSALSLFGANLLSIHPQIILSEGKMKVHRKYRGKMEKVVTNYCADTLVEFADANLDTAFITYTTATEEMISIARTALENKGFKNIYETKAGATISSHCGENTLGILYLNK